MVLHSERWLELRRFRALHESGMSISEISRETGLNRRTVRKYLSSDASPGPPRKVTAPASGGRRRVIAEVEPIIDVWLRREILLKGSVIHERLVKEYGFTGNYQRVKMYLSAGPAADRSRVGHRFRRTRGPAPPVRGGTRSSGSGRLGDEGAVLAHVGIPKVYSFHMVLSYSRDPFCCFTTSMDLAAFWGSHVRAFEHFGGVPKAIVYDRTKTVVRRHVAPGQAVPLHPEAVAFSGHHDFDIDVLAAYRPTGKGRVERQVTIVRDRRPDARVPRRRSAGHTCVRLQPRMSNSQ